METGRIVIITGAAGGMGRQFVRRFVDNGDIVVATDLSDTALAVLAGDTDSKNLHIKSADMSDEASVNTLADFVRSELGHADVLINNAGWFPIQQFEDITVDDFRKVVDVNLTGTFIVTKAIYPLMKGRGWGRIVNIGSGSAFPGVATQVHYVAAKSGFFGLTRSIARAIGHENITVNCVTPGLTVTENVRENFPEELLDKVIGARSMQREQTADDLVGPVFWLASPDSGFVTGQTINVDGGSWNI